jgi:Flp pilus assembly protein TadG
VVVSAFLGKLLLDRSGDTALSFLLIALVVIAMAAVSGWWLKQLAREVRA